MPDVKVDAAKKSPAELPAAGMGMTRGQVKALIDDGTLPTFRPLGRTVRCAKRSFRGVEQATLTSAGGT